MPAAAPATVEAFVDLVRKSDLIEQSRFDSYREQLGTDTPDRPHRLARKMVADGLLTNFQAEQLLKGKHKGFTLGNYVLLERIGRGGMGMVYLAEHSRMHHRVALKVLPPEQAENPTVRERFYREARAAALVTHPNLVRAHDIDCTGGIHYLVMEYVDGVTLHHLVAKHGPLSVERAAHYIGQAAVGLEYAFEISGMVHRDIKPGNLVVDRTGTVKILDMGLARLGQASFFEGNAEAITQLHNDKSVLGTADYIAPEQALNSQAADTRADLYSLGATFYFLLTGRPPFPTGSVAQKLMWHQMREPDPIEQLRPDLPGAITRLIQWLMAKDPDKRPQHPGEVVLALLPWIEAAVPPPNAVELPKMCPAAQGPASNSAGPLSSITLGTRLPRLARSSAETPSSGSQTDSFSPSAALGDRPPSSLTASVLIPTQIDLKTPEGKRPSLPPWVLAASLLLSAAVGALLCWGLLGR
jgi:serine/threonine protein kinase